MSTNKKTTKATKSPAPATKTTKSAAPKAAKASTAKSRKTEAAAAAIVATVTRVAASELAAAPAVAEAPALREKPGALVAVKEVTGKSVITTIRAQIDVGFGNALYLRGEGPGLSWEKGVPMTNLGADLWQFALGESARPFTFKFLINDVIWCAGADYSLSAGDTKTFSPVF
jgi:hypothetical protein